MMYENEIICNDVNKFQKGQIWWIVKDEDAEKEKMSNPNITTAAKSRPWLIVSDNDYNNHYGRVTAVPVLTIHSGYVLGETDIVISSNGKDRFAKCNEPQTYNKFEVNGNFMGTVSDSIMEKVDAALGIYLGITPKDPSIKYIESLIAKKFDITKERSSELESLFVKLGALVGGVKPIENKPVVSAITTRPTPVHASSAITVTPKSNNVKPTAFIIPNASELKDDKADTPKVIAPKVTRKRTYMKWNDEKIVAFVNDYIRLGYKETASKYGLTNKTVQNYYKKYYKEVKNIKKSMVVKGC